ncbi:MAG: toxin-antitoxin system YwqK family antitoxin [Pseudomonas sp.]
MKKPIAAAFIAAALAGCNAEIDHAQAQIQNGLIYRYGETDPFSGSVLNMPVGLPGLSALCNSQVAKGRYNGKTECFYGEQKVLEVEYSSGNKDGAEQVFDAKTGNKVAVTHWKSGRQDGVAEQYANGTLISRKEYKAGKLDGDETRWTEDGKTVLTQLTWRAGNKQEGFEEDSNGKFNYVNSQLHGPQLRYDYMEGKQLKHYISAEEQYNHGKLDGVQKRFVNILHTDIIQPESQITYDKGVAVAGWLNKFAPLDGSVTHKINLVQSAKSQDEDFHSDYPGNLVPDGIVKREDNEGEDVWANGVKIKFSYNYGEPGYQVLDGSTPHGSYRNVSHAEYIAFGARSSSNSVTTHSPAAGAANENCLDKWITTFRDETEADALISNEQLEEWKAWCRDGKRP